MGDLSQGFCPIGIESDVFIERMAREPFGVFLSTDIGDDGTTEVHRIPFFIEDNFRRIGIEQCLFKITICCKGGCQCSDADAGIGKTVLECLNLLRLDERFVSLDIDHDIVAGSYLLVGLEASVCTAPVLIRGHDYLTAECQYGTFDTRIVCGDTDFV